MKACLFWGIPTINIIFMNIFKYAENICSFSGAYNWWGQFLLIIVELICYGLHYLLAFLMPVLLYKRKKELCFKSWLFVVTAVLAANVIMLIFELLQAGIDRFPQYMVAPVCITMGTVIIVSTLVCKMSKRQFTGKERENESK